MPDLITRRAPLARGTLNLEQRTVDAVLSTGASVERRDARGAFIERLNLAGAVLHDGADRVPLLDNHRRDTIGAVLGYCDGIRNDGSEIRATLHLTDDRALSLIDAGAITATSVGYLPFSESWRQEGGTRVRDLTPVIYETSLAIFAADPGAAILRSDPMETIENRAEINAGIRNLVRSASLPGEFADALIDRGADLAETRAAAFDEIIKRGVHLPASYQTTGGDEPAQLVSRMSEALSHRLGTPGELSAEARPYAGMGLHAMGRAILSARGERVLSLSPEQLLLRMVTTGDLPGLLVESGQRTLMAAYTAAASALKIISRQSTAADFRNKVALRSGLTGLLERVPESAEVRHGGATETRETYAISTYAKIWSLSRQALINDNLGAFADMSGQMGRVAAETEARLLADLLMANPLMDDGVPLFDSAHGNEAATGTTIDAASLAAGVQAMRVQTGISGEPINAVPVYLLVSPEMEFVARQAVATYYPATAADTTPFTFTVLVEPRLTGKRWYLFADPAALPVLEYSYLSSAPGPQMQSREGFDVLGMEFRVLLDYGAGVLSHLGGYSNPGA